jgi:ABC-type uncharacterized transport system auxiliary subunit
MHTPTSHRPAPRLIAGAILLLASAACGGARHHLGEYTFADHTMAVAVLSTPAPGLVTGGYNVMQAGDAVEAAVNAGSKVVKDVEGRRARARLDSATARMRLTDSLARRTLERTSRYLGVRPVTSVTDADYLLEVHMRNFGIDVRGQGADLYTNAEAVLLERRTGREIWNIKVHGNDRLSPRVYGAGKVPGTIISAGALHTISVADFESALDQLMSLSANVVADELRAALRDVRRSR